MADESVRVCPTHRVVLEERRSDVLYCPAGRHKVKRWLVVNRRNSRALYEATAEKGATRMPEATETAEVKKHEPKSQTLDRAKFQDGSMAFLFIRLTREPKRYGGDPFRIRWQQGPQGGLGKKGTIGGVAKTCPDEASARDAFKAVVRSATGQGWKQVAVGHGARVLELKPIPAPKKPATRRGR